MGGRDDFDDEVIIIDELTTVRKRSRAHGLCLDRLIVTPAGLETRVSWGLKPLVDRGAVLSLAGGTLFLSSDEVDDEAALLEGLSRRRFAESFEADADGSFYVSTYHSLHWAGGIYHVVLPERFVPRATRISGGTRIVHLKKSSRDRIVMTFLFSEHLALDFKIGSVTQSQFRRIDLEKLASENETPKSTSIRDIMAEAAKLPTSPDAWKVLFDAIHTSRNSEPCGPLLVERLSAAGLTRRSRRRPRAGRA
jgi:hypothetical protein